MSRRLFPILVLGTYGADFNPTGDGLHPNAAGARAIASALLA
jgi:lysophospholipase L1-like esterase